METGMQLDFTDMPTLEAAAQLAMESAGQLYLQAGQAQDDMVHEASKMTVQLLGFEGEDAEQAHHQIVSTYETMRLRGPWFVLIFFLLFWGIFGTLFAFDASYSYNRSLIFCTQKTDKSWCPSATVA